MNTEPLVNIQSEFDIYICGLGTFSWCERTDKKSSLKRKRKSSKKNGKKKLKRKHYDKKKDKSLTKNVRINESNTGLDEKMTPGNQ